MSGYWCGKRRKILGWPTGIEPVLSAPQAEVITIIPWPPQYLPFDHQRTCIVVKIDLQYSQNPPDCQSGGFVSVYEDGELSFIRNSLKRP